MKVYEIILIGVALAMDAFALTVANCTAYNKNLTPKRTWAMPVTFALFQFVMPILGYYVGSLFSEFLSDIAGYLTAGVFFALAIKIVVDILREKSDETKPSGKFTVTTLLLQGVATSIDALLIGVTFAVELDFSIFIAGAIIGAVTFAIVTVALYIGKGLGKVLGEYAEYAGALILFALALKNLLETVL